MCDALTAALSAAANRRTLLKGLAGTGAAAALTGVATSPAAAATADAAGRNFDAKSRTKVVLLGTAGGPPWWPGSDRQGCSSAVVVGDRYYLVDVGYGFGPQLRKARLGNWSDMNNGPLDALRATFLTHLHSDHTIDLNNLLVLGAANGALQADRPIQIWGPGRRGPVTPLFGPPPAPPVTAPENPTPGTVDTVDLIIRAYAADINDRAFDQRKAPPTQTFSAHDVPIPTAYTADPNGTPCPRMSPVTFYEDDRVRVSATLVQHAPVFPALGFRFDTDDGSIVFSGDTGPHPNVVELARGADILVHEVIAQEWVDGLFPEPRTEVQQALVQHLVRSHTTIEQVGPIAEEADVQTLVLSHVVPANWPDGKFAHARKGFSGRLVIGRDLDVIGIPRRR